MNRRKSKERAKAQAEQPSKLDPFASNLSRRRRRKQGDHKHVGRFRMLRLGPGGTPKDAWEWSATKRPPMTVRNERRRKSKVGRKNATRTQQRQRTEQQREAYRDSRVGDSPT